MTESAIGPASSILRLAPLSRIDASTLASSAWAASSESRAMTWPDRTVSPSFTLISAMIPSTSGRTSAFWAGRTVNEPEILSWPWPTAT